MPNCLNNFSTTDIHILENGLRWITEEQEGFANKFYLRILRDHPALNSFLLSMGTESFSKCLVRSLESIIREFRAYGEMITPLKNYWPEFSSTKVASLKHSEIIRVAETFIDLVSELAEDVWSPTLEYTWRKAVKTVMTELWEPVQDFSNSSFMSHSKTFLLNNGEGRTMTHPMRLGFGPMMLLVGTIAAVGLWVRCFSGESRLKTRTPWHFSVCS